MKYQNQTNLFDKVDVWLGKQNSVMFIQIKDIYKTIKKGQKRKIKVKIIYDGPIEAPIKKDEILAKLKVIYDQDLIGEYDLLAYKKCKKSQYFF